MIAVRRTRSPDTGPVILGLVLTAMVLVAVSFGLDRAGYEVVVGAIVALLIVVGGYPVLQRVVRQIGHPELFSLFYWALVTKMVASVLRYMMVFTLYGGLGDSAEYDIQGWRFAQAVRGGSLAPSMSISDGPTANVVRVVGYLYAITGRSIYAGFFVFALAAFAGVVLFARGVELGVPEIDSKRLYAVLLFFPSLLFWSASIGKDAIMVFLLGLSVYGAGKLLGPVARPIGLVPFGLGLAGMLAIRPHVGLMSVMAILVAIGVSVISRTKSNQTSTRSRFVRTLALIVLLGGAIVASQSVTRLFSEQAGEATSTSGALALAERRTSVGGSKFDPVAVTSPASIPAAFVSAFFRPFPWEVRNGQTVVAAVEALLLALLLAVSCRRWGGLPRLAWSRPLLVFAFAYILMFVVAFSYIGNLGILARQRPQALPFLLLFAALPLATGARRDVPGNVSTSPKEMGEAIPT